MHQLRTPMRMIYFYYYLYIYLCICTPSNQHFKAFPLAIVWIQFRDKFSVSTLQGKLKFHSFKAMQGNFLSTFIFSCFMHVSMYMYVCMYACMDGCKDVCLYVSICIYMYLYMHVHVCIYVCMCSIGFCYFLGLHSVLSWYSTGV